MCTNILVTYLSPVSPLIYSMPCLWINLPSLAFSGSALPLRRKSKGSKSHMIKAQVYQELYPHFLISCTLHWATPDYLVLTQRYFLMVGDQKIFVTLLGWPQISFWFFHKMLQKKPNEICGQHNKSNLFGMSWFYFTIWQSRDSKSLPFKLPFSLGSPSLDKCPKAVFFPFS